MKTIVVTFQIIAEVIFQLAGSPGLGGAGGVVRGDSPYAPGSRSRPSYASPSKKHAIY